MADNSRSRTWLWIVIGGGAFFLFVLAVFSLVYLAVKSDNRTEFAGGFGDKIAVVDLEGVILDAKEFVKQVKKYDDDSSIKAIIIRIDSPGGGAAASQEMYQAVKRVRDRKKKPIIPSIR